MTPNLPPGDIRKLLGGYATGSLTPEEQAALFAAALEDQDLFDTLAREQALKDHLADPVARAELLAALDPPRLSFWQWLRRPAVAGLVTAGFATLALLGVWQATRPGALKQAAPLIVAEVRPPQSAPAASQETVPEPVPEALPLPKGKLARDAAPADSGTPFRRKEVIALAPAATPPPPPPAPALAAPLVAANRAMDQNESALQKAAKSEAAGATRAAPFTTGFVAGAASAPAAPAPAPLRVTVLRESGEAPTSTPLNPGETIRLRIAAPPGGTLSILEANQVLATATPQPQQPFDTPPLPFTGSGARQLTVSFAPTPAAAPLILTVTLTYR